MSERQIISELKPQLPSEEIIALKQRFHSDPELLGKVAEYRTRLYVADFNEDNGTTANPVEPEWAEKHIKSAVYHLGTAVNSSGDYWPQNIAPSIYIGELVQDYDNWVQEQETVNG